MSSTAVFSENFSRSFTGLAGAKCIIEFPICRHYCAYLSLHLYIYQQNVENVHLTFDRRLCSEPSNCMNIFYMRISFENRFFCLHALRRQSKRPIIHCVAVCYTLRNGGVIHYSDIRRVHTMRWHRPLRWPNNPTVFMRLSDTISQHHRRLADSIVAQKFCSRNSHECHESKRFESPIMWNQTAVDMWDRSNLETV